MKLVFVLNGWLHNPKEKPKNAEKFKELSKKKEEKFNFLKKLKVPNAPQIVCVSVGSCCVLVVGCYICEV